ncbi:unnamed protein product [Discula destructiva]
MSFKVKSLFEYASGHDDDLPFGIGQIITVTEEVDDDWYQGEYIDEAGAKQEGMFPRNFVEKFEPVAPPRPTRTRPKKESESGPEEPSAAAEEPAPTPALAPPAELENASASSISSPPQQAVEPVPVTSPRAPETAQPILPSSPPQVRAENIVQSPPKEAPAKRGPPPVTEKPATVSNSFRDRIAAFNKSSAPPITPFKPGGLGGAGGSSSFIKKPFVAPPPKGNTYVPTQRNAPIAPVYRRDEDPEIKEREAENTENAQKAGLLPSEAQEGDEDEPKPMSLKERMALLQRQQQEQAARHAEAAAKKEKPKRPATKPRMLSHESAAEGAEESEAAESVPLERRDTGATSGKPSLDEPRPPRVPAQPRRKPSVDPEPRDGNEADMSGAGETTDNQEENLTEREDSDEKPPRAARMSVSGHSAPVGEDQAEEKDEDEDEEEAEEDEETAELRRKEELRARMARLGGGMGMPGMFGMPMPGAGAPSLAPKKKKPSVSVPTDKPRTSEDARSPTSPRAPPVPAMMALPGMGRPKQAEEEEAVAEEEDEEEVKEPALRSPPAVPAAAGGAPPVPGGRPAPPPVPAGSRPAPPPPPAPPSEGSESDDELSGANDPMDTPRGEEPPATRAPPPLPPLTAPAPPVPAYPLSPTSPKCTDDAVPTSPSSSKRASRPPPPVPGVAAAPPSQTRAPPPPPPGGLPRTSTSAHAVDDDEVTEYEGDYDTDIGSSVPHKDALKHGRESSVDDALSITSPTAGPPVLPPPIPSAAAPRGPPPVPSQPPREPDSRQSIDAPRAAPPPPPPAPAREPSLDDEYDPYNYAARSSRAPAAPTYSEPPPPPRRASHAPSQDSYTGEPSSYQQSPPASSGSRAAAAPRGSIDGRPSRRSVDLLNRPSMESGHVANDIDLAPQSGWWLQPKGLPPQLQGRMDLFHESEESQSTQRGQKTTITRDIYILFQDYSQTVITVRFDPQDAKDVHLEQRHEGPPRSLRQDQLEESYERFGRPISEAVNKNKDTVVGDGTPQGLVLELLKPFKDALFPVGTRAYGALVYSNLANASTTQTDQIRPGDIISIRNAKFQGKHGPMHAKYSTEVGKPDHVGVVAEWDGTKKKIRAWEQGRESKKVKVESFKLDDLRSGEVKIWRVMPRSWVGWEGQN